MTQSISKNSHWKEFRYTSGIKPKFARILVKFLPNIVILFIFSIIILIYSAYNYIENKKFTILGSELIIFVVICLAILSITAWFFACQCLFDYKIVADHNIIKLTYIYTGINKKFNVSDCKMFRTNKEQIKLTDGKEEEYFYNSEVDDLTGMDIHHFLTIALK